MKTKGALCLAIGVLLFAVGGPALTEQVEPVTISVTPAKWLETVEMFGISEQLSREQQDAQDWAYFQDCVASHKCDETSATFYSYDYHGRNMANGEIYDMYNSTTCAANEYDIGTWLRVWGPETFYLERGPTEYANYVDVRVTDRGLMNRAIDLSYGAFENIAPHSRGTVKVWVEVLP